MKQLTLLVFALILFACNEARVEEVSLHNNWKIAPAKKLQSDGQTLSTVPATGDVWVNAKVPCTVLGALADAGVYPDIFFADNMDKIDREQFRSPWWYQTSFDIDGLNGNEVVRLLFDGINYRANIWLNGQQVAGEKEIWNAFRQFDLNITPYAKSKGNILAVEIIPPRPRDFFMGFVDWAPVPNDQNMGIFRQVRLKRTGKASVDAVFVHPKVDKQSLKSASLTLSAEVTNYAETQKTLTVSGVIENLRVEKTLTLKGGEKQLVTFSPAEFEQLNLQNPRLWWPHGLGSAEMYTLVTELRDGSVVIDRQTTRFGIREIDTYLNEKGVRGYKVNGRPVFIKSGGWVDDLLLRDNTRTNTAQIQYVKDMNMNSIRMEGFWGTSQEIFDLCDENGILNMIGWSCQWEWPDYLGLELKIEEGDDNLPINEGVDKYSVKLTPDEKLLFRDMLKDQVRWLRNHPSIFVWATGSDAMPPADLEQMYLELLKNEDPSRSLLVSCGEFTSTLTGPSGMKMFGPYDYVPPVYWFEDTERGKLGGAYGFNTETGPGPQIPPIESIRKMIPEKDLWPIDNKMWEYHSGRKDFSKPTIYVNALTKRYGEAKNLEELCVKSQLMNYEAIRPMFEAFALNRHVANGLVQWQLNSGWPEIYWQLYDWYLMPNGAYFGTMKACQPINAIYNYHNDYVYLSNDKIEPLQGAKARLQLLDANSKVVFEESRDLQMKENSVEQWVKLTDHLKQGVYFLSLSIEKEGKELANNFYWLAARRDVMDWKTYSWFYTPQKEYADFSALNSLQPVALEASKRVVSDDAVQTVMEVTLKNSSSHISFFNELLLQGSESKASILPVFWSDNYISLLPGQTRTLTVRVNKADLGAQQPVVKIQGYNLTQSIELK